jgi:uncharacterized protein (TIGR03437 family)
VTTKKRITYTFLTAMVPALLLAFSTGPDVRHTAAPGDDPLGCATAGCHTGSAKGGPINAAGGAVTASFSSGSSYTPDQPVTITVNVTDPVNSLHGFQMSARLGTTDADLSTRQAGRFSFTPESGVFVLCDNNVPRIPDGNCPANFPVEFIEHSSPRTGTWTFTWTPPATDQGPVHFYVAGNAVNGDGRNGPQDHVYTASYVLQPLTTSCSLPIPVITEVRRIEGWGDGTTFSSGSWLEIRGSNLAKTTRLWLDSDFHGSDAPTALEETSASVNGKAGFIEYISPTQINLQAPADSATGPVAVAVTNCAGTSNPVTGANLQKVASGILAPPPEISPLFNSGGKQYGEATFGFQFLFVGNANPDFPGLFQPAKPNDSILLYAIGLGDTTPAMIPGVTATGQEVLNAQVAVNFGTTPATVTRVALYPTFAGLYYIAVTVPNVPDGDYQINITVDGQPLQQQPFFLTVHH